MSDIVPGWYENPLRPGTQAHWDGQVWSEPTPETAIPRPDFLPRSRRVCGILNALHLLAAVPLVAFISLYALVVVGLTTTDGSVLPSVALITVVVAVVAVIPPMLIHWGLVGESEAKVSFGIAITLMQLIPIAREFSSSPILIPVAALASAYLFTLLDAASSRLRASGCSR